MDRTELNQIVSRFAGAWDRGECPDFDAFLPAADPPRGAVVAELARLDLVRRLGAGLEARAETYLERYPELTRDRAAALALIAAEHSARREEAPSSSAESYLARFPQYAQDLPTLLDLAPESGSVEPGRDSEKPSRHDRSSVPPPTVACGEGAGPEAIDDAGFSLALTEPGAPWDLSEEGFTSLPRFSLLRRIGAGGMGVVYEAHDRQRQERVALKTLRHVNAEAIYHFKNEFRSLADLSHPNLVSLHELFSVSGRWFFTMEYVEGQDLLTYISAAPDRPARRARLQEVLGQLAEGLCALHASGTLHRDIKPSNVLVTDQGRVVLLDFGLATVMPAEDSTSDPEPRLAGTADYMAPEQATEATLKPAADWYSVGVILFEALTTRLPFRGTPTDVLEEKLKADPPDPRLLRHNVPDDLAALCLDLLLRRPEDRPTGSEILRRLARDSGGSGPPARAPASASSQLIGRREHLDRLAGALAEVRHQHRAVSVLVHGRSGLGKSELVRRFLRNLVRNDEAIVLESRCHDRESVPYKALDGVMDALSGYLKRLPRPETEGLLPPDVLALARAFPVLRRIEALADPAGSLPEVPDPQELRRRVAVALRELLARLADRRPLVLAIDDLRMGDLDGAALLAELLRPPDSPALLLLGCYRDEDTTTSPFLRAFLDPAGLAAGGPAPIHLAVDPLTPAEALDLARELIGPDDPRAEVIAHESAGHPYFLQELARTAQRGGGRSGPAGLTLDELIGEQVSRLAEPARRLLEVVALAGRPLARADASRAAGLDGGEPAALAALRTDRLIRTTWIDERNAVETYHDRIRKVVLSRLTPDVLIALHGQLARALEGSGRADPEELSNHFAAAGRSEPAALYAELAAERAAEVLAFDQAARLYQRALELHPRPAPEARDLRRRCGEALTRIGREAEAARYFREAADGTDPPQSLDLRPRTVD